MSKKVYWLFYSTEDFSAFVIRLDEGRDPKDVQYKGPFKTAKAAREYGLALIKGDMAELKDMRSSIKGRVHD